MAHNSKDYKRSSPLIEFLTPIYISNLGEDDRGCRLHDQRNICESMKARSKKKEALLTFEHREELCSNKRSTDKGLSKAHNTDSL